MIFSQKYN